MASSLHVSLIPVGSCQFKIFSFFSKIVQLLLLVALKSRPPRLLEANSGCSDFRWIDYCKVLNSIPSMY